MRKPFFHIGFIMTRDVSLIERLEMASEGSRELDFAILSELGFVYERNVWRKADDAMVEHAARTFFTTSIDAAKALVPEGPSGWSWWTGNESGTGNAFLIPNQDNAGSRYEFDAATPALALCIAAIRARSAS